MGMRRLLTTWMVVCGASIGLASPAMAQEDTGNETFLSTTSTSTTSTAMVTALGVLTVVTITPKPGRKALRLYLEQNAVAVLDGMGSGGGQSVADLSGAFGVETDAEESAFGKVLRSERVALGAMLEDHQVSDDEVKRFILTVYRAMLAHDALTQAARRIEG